MIAYSIKWNAADECWVGRVKHPETGAWLKKRVPKDIGRKAQLDAEGFIHAWYAETFTKLQAPSKPRSVSATVNGKKTLAILAPRWLQLRSLDNTRTKPNTYRGFQLSVNNWILDRQNFPHTSIQDLDVETELTISDVRSWILSLKGARSSRLQHISTLSSLLEDCSGEEWLGEDFVSPFLKAPIRKLVDDLHKKRKAEQFITSLTKEQASDVLTKHHYKVKTYRRMRYLLAIGTGIRDSEIQGLVFGDLHLSDPVPYIRIERQLETIGKAPFLMYDKLVEAGKSREEIGKEENAVCNSPKYDSKRSIPLHPTVLAGLRWWKEEGWQKLTGVVPTPSDPVFPSETGAFCFSDSAMLWKQDLKRLGLPTVQVDSSGDEHPITFHSTRHTFSTLLEAAGVSAEQIGTLLGHGAKSTVRSNYLGQNLKLFQELVATLPLPSGADVVKTAAASGVKLTKNKTALELARSTRTIHLDVLAVRSKRDGTLLRHLSLQRSSDLFDAWQHYRRTGVETMTDAAKIIITFNSLAKAVNLDPDKKTSFTSAEKKEIMAEIATRLETWSSGIGPFRGAAVVELDPKFKSSATKTLHHIFQKRGGDTQEISLDSLAAFYVAASDKDEDMAEVRENLRLLVKQDGKAFLLGAGPSPKVVRMLNDKGKATDATAPAVRGSGAARNSAEGIQRFTERVRSLGYSSKAQFERAKLDIGSQAPTSVQLVGWLNSHKN